MSTGLFALSAADNIIKAFIKSGRPNLLSNTDPEVADKLLAKAIKEIDDLSPKLFVKWNVAWARREVE